MGTHQYKKAWIPSIVFAVSLPVALLIGGCGGPGGTRPRPTADLGTTIGSLVEVFSSEAIAVEGYGLVGGLPGTGSGECPPEIRAYLKRYILTQLSEQKINADKLISSRNTAVVLLYGIMPVAVSKDRYFDVKVAALADTQTTSLEGGRLYGAELKRAGGFGITTRVLAKAKGPVFIDIIDAPGTDKKAGYILGGGIVLDEYKIRLSLQPDYITAGLIRNKLNERFGGGTAKALSPGLIELEVPAKYKKQKQRFLSIVKATYLAETPGITKERIETFVRRLAGSEDKEQSEIALEAIGNKCLTKLAGLLNSPNDEVRLRAARCMLNLGSDRGLESLRAIAMDKGSAHRIEALETIASAASRNVAAAILRRLLRDQSFDIRLAAYENLRKLDDIAVMQSLIAGDFYLEQIAQTRYKSIFVSRSGRPRIVLFGAPIYCHENIFVQSADGSITINARAGQKYVSVIRKLPGRLDIPPIPLESSFELSDIIQTLCESAIVKEGSTSRPGLNVSYADAIYILKQMCEKGMLEAEFRAGPLPKID
jgi:hypothetical protein